MNYLRAAFRYGRRPAHLAQRVSPPRYRLVPPAWSCRPRSDTASRRWWLSSARSSRHHWRGKFQTLEVPLLRRWCVRVSPEKLTLTMERAPAYTCCATKSCAVSGPIACKGSVTVSPATDLFAFYGVMSGFAPSCVVVSL